MVAIGVPHKQSEQNSNDVERGTQYVRQNEENHFHANTYHENEINQISEALSHLRLVKEKEDSKKHPTTKCIIFGVTMFVAFLVLITILPQSSWTDNNVNHTQMYHSSHYIHAGYPHGSSSSDGSHSHSSHTHHGYVGRRG